MRLKSIFSQKGDLCRKISLERWMLGFDCKSKVLKKWVLWEKIYDNNHIRVL